MEPKYTLVVGNPFWDKTTYVSEEFLENNSLKKNESIIEFDKSRMRILWEEAKNNQKLPGRCGGSGFNLMIPLTKFGNSCAILGRIGSDKTEKKIKKHIEGLGVHSLLIKTEDHNTGRVLCFITPDNERSMLAHVGATVKLNPSDLKEEELSSYNHWHIEGYAVYAGIVSKCVEIASQNNATVSLNLPTKNVVTFFKKDFESSIPYLHYIFGNKEEMEELTGFNEIEKIFAYFKTEQTVAMTDGPNACWVKASGEDKPTSYDVPKVENVINKTGAGDIWAGALLGLLLKGRDIQTSVEMANQVAASWIQQKPGSYVEEKTWETFKNQVFGKR